MFCSVGMEEKSLEKDQWKTIRTHPLFFGIALGLLAEVINSR